MSKRLLHAKRFIPLLALAVSLFLIAAPATAEPKEGKQDALIAQIVCEYLKRGHLSQPEINDDISRRVFRRFLKGLDPNKLYFVQADFDEFKKSETDLDDQLLKGELTFPYKVYERLLTRVGERQKLVDEFVGAQHDYTVQEFLDTDPDTIEYAKTDDEMRERWRKRIKFDLLLQRMGDKPVAEAEAKEKVLTRYKSLAKRWKQVDNADLLEIYLTDLTTSIDPHSTYMSPTTLADFEIAMRLNLDGIGAVLRSENGTTIVVEVVPGGAAGKDGRLKPNDKIVAVAQGDDKFVDAVDMKLQEVVKMVRGPRGTKVQLKVVPVGKIEPIVIDLTRQKVELKAQEARGDIVEQGKKADGKPYLVGVIDLPSFYADAGNEQNPPKSATEDVRKILKEFKDKKVDGVVLDLRHNGGGLLNEALSLTGLFIDQGPIVQVKGSNGKILRKDDPEKGTVYAGPMIVLTSRFSASASEILAGALQDYNRALLVGDTTTYGKGTVQTVIDLGSQARGDTPSKLGALKMTIQQFYRANGDSTQVRGVVSDVAVPSLTEYLTEGEKESEHALPFDKVKPADHEDVGLVTPELKTGLKEKSAARVKESKDFVKQAKDIELLKERKARKKVTLNEKELKAQFSKDDAEKLDGKGDDPPSDTPAGAPYKFKRNFTNNEVLQIMEDFMQSRKPVAGR